MDKDIAVLTGEIIALSCLIGNADNPIEVMNSYAKYGCVNKLDINIYLNGWKPNYDPDIFESVDIEERQWNTKEEIIGNLQKVKHFLIKLARGCKINFAYLPYEVEKVKHYNIV